MKLQFSKVTQPMLTDEFARRPAAPPTVPIKRRVVVRTVSAEQDRMARRREHEGAQLRKTLEFKRLVAAGMSRVEANRKVWG